MAKKASTTTTGKAGSRAGGKTSAAKKKTAGSGGGAQRARTAKASSSKSSQSQAGQRAKTEKTSNAADAVVKLLESPLVIDLLAVGASAALATLAEHRFSRRDRNTNKVDTGRAVKAAGTAAASAIGRRLVEEWDEIRRASAEESKAGGGS